MTKKRTGLNDPQWLDKLLSRIGLKRKRRKTKAPENKALGRSPEDKSRLGR